MFRLNYSYFICKFNNFSIASIHALISPCHKAILGGWTNYTHVSYISPLFISFIFCIHVFLYVHIETLHSTQIGGFYLSTIFLVSVRSVIDEILFGTNFELFFYNNFWRKISAASVFWTHAKTLMRNERRMRTNYATPDLIKLAFNLNIRLSH